MLDFDKLDKAIHEKGRLAIMTLLAALAGATWGTRLFDRLPMFGKRGDMLVYGCLALGLFFAFKLVVTGSL